METGPGRRLAFRFVMPSAMPDDHVDPVVETAATAAHVTGERGAPVGISGGYQPALDGIRAIAVGVVIMFHLGQQWSGTPLGGGWLGVDMFFVLSGYLITALLIAERDRTGRTNLRNFYARRLLRLAPLSILLVAVCWGGQRLGLRVLARALPADQGRRVDPLLLRELDAPVVPGFARIAHAHLVVVDRGAVLPHVAHVGDRGVWRSRSAAARWLLGGVGRRRRGRLLALSPPPLVPSSRNRLR